MEILYLIVMTLVKVYKFFHHLAVKMTAEPMVKVIMDKFQSIGVNMVLADPAKKTRAGRIVGYENSIGKYEGAKPTMTVYDVKFFERMSAERSLGIAESYIDGLWDSDSIELASCQVMGNDMQNYLYYPLEKLAHYAEFGLFNLQTCKRASESAGKHYDLGDTLFASFLDKSMTYSCAYWKDAQNLDDAQTKKMDLIARKLKLKPGMRVLDIGSGWGGLAKFLAQNYKVSVVGCNLSREGCKTAAKRCEGLSVEIRCCDYRELNEKFDRIVSVGMFEHVGPHNYKEFFRVAHRCLKEHGIFLLHTIGSDNEEDMRDDPFFCTYIFPNGAIPRPSEIPKCSSKLFLLEDWHNLGDHYRLTLLAWYDNFVRNWPTIKGNFKDPVKFYRMWSYYLLGAAGAFKARKLRLWQIVLTKNGVPGGYESVR